MLKQKIKYTDFDGNEQEEVFYFNLGKLELLEMEVGGTGGSFGAWIQRIVDANDRSILISEFKKMVLLAYGQRSEDGKRFIKNDQLREEFSQTAAFESLFLSMAEDEDFAIAFLRGALPADMNDDFNTAVSNAPASTPAIPPKPVS
jgi:hypothetical protein